MWMVSANQLEIEASNLQSFKGCAHRVTPDPKLDIELFECVTRLVWIGSYNSSKNRKVTIACPFHFDDNISYS